MVQILLLNYFSIATVAFRIAFIQQSYHGGFSCIKKMIMFEPAFQSDRKCDRWCPLLLENNDKDCTL